MRTMRYGGKRTLATKRSEGKIQKPFKTFQFLSSDSPVAESSLRGDPKKSAHPPVNADLGPYIHAACSMDQVSLPNLEGGVAGKTPEEPCFVAGRTASRIAKTSTGK